MTTIDPYVNTAAYLDDYFTLLALRLHRAVLLTRLLRGPDTNEAFLGLFLSEAEVDTLLAELHGATLTKNGEIVLLEAAATALSKQIKDRLAVTRQPLRPQQIAGLFHLSSQAVELLLLLLAPEVDNRFGRVYAYLQDDVTRRWLSPGLALQLLSGTAPNDPTGRALFMPNAPLVEAQLIHIVREREGLAIPLIDRSLKLDDAIVEYMLEHDTLDPRLAGLILPTTPEHTWHDLILEPTVQTQLTHLIELWQNPGAPAAFFWGRVGSGKATAVAALARTLGRSLLTLDGTVLALRPLPEQTRLLSLAIRQAQLRHAILHLRSLDVLDEKGRATALRQLRPGLILSARTPYSFHELANPPITIHFPVPSFDLRQQLWQTALNGRFQMNGHVPTELAGRFRLTPGQINQAARAAQQHAWLRDGPKAIPNQADLFEGCRQQSNPSLARLATKVVSPYTWNDLILPDTQLSLLHAVESQVRHIHTVYQQWGFDSKLALGKGLTALFSGISGTGKTMAAGILAHALGLDMYKIDLSGVVSKYIGETEKNLSHIFDEASTANAILFFDEADALFGKRSEVKDAHDRYANIEISYLLQKMEEYEGVAILATNFSQNMDEAFTRRLQFHIPFPSPQADDREHIWRGLFPTEAPRADNIDFAFLAHQFELTGGHIKNCVLAAAFMAAEEGVPIGMSHLLQGVVRELGKLGRPITRASFAEYFTMIRRRS